MLIGTGTGATGWCRSAWLERHSTLALPAPPEPQLCWFVREAWPSIATGADVTEGVLEATESLVIRAESDLVIFGDGIESDSITLTWGQEVSVSVADRQLHLVAARAT